LNERDAAKFLGELGRRAGCNEWQGGLMVSWQQDALRLHGIMKWAAVLKEKGKLCFSIMQWKNTRQMTLIKK